MYKLLLCSRYLRTRYLAFVCIVSVMLGVATLIVVNAVMSGFSTKLRDRLHGNISDVVVDTERADGFPATPAELRQAILHSPVGDKIAAISPTVEVFAILQFTYPNGAPSMKPVRLMGVDPASRAAVGGFAEYLVGQKDNPNPSFALTPEAEAQLKRNREHAAHLERVRAERDKGLDVPAPLVPDPMALPPANLFGDEKRPEPPVYGTVLGYSIAHVRFTEGGVMKEEAILRPGDAVTIMTAGGAELKPVWGSFVVADYVKTEMSEYDSNFVFVPLEQLQRIRGMGDRCTALQIKLKNYDRDKAAVTAELERLFPPRDGNRVATWEQNQGPLLTAIDVERGILNILLFMIVGVAGFSILAIFTMIVSEKFRDIGVLKSLGASSGGVLSIFLGYGLLLGGVGAGLGTVMGLWFTRNINEIEAGLSKVTGTAVFPRDIYYFKEIPTNVDTGVVLLINAGAVVTAVVFSLLPAWRAARLHPVRALRFE
ncbi:MAG TPA: FtsX-like permease family protein, partial [Urbifossiella sp.]|nr:FtsX-like permease family protein [Urbifossiella sp.]